MSPAPAPGSPAQTAAALTLVVAALSALGLVLVYSSSSVGIALQEADPTLFLRRQLLWLSLACGVFALARTTDAETLRRHALPILGGVAGLLLLVLLAGSRAGGARRWLALGGIRFQPSELAKLGLVIFTAAHAAGRRERLATLKGAVPPFLGVGLIVGLIAVEPDMGTALLTGTVATTMLLVAGVRLRHLALLATPGFLALVLFAFTKLGYIRRRVEDFLDPTPDLSGTGYQAQQALIALGSGGPFGLGLGASQQKRMFLPEVHTDYIFALVGEELGFAGTAMVLTLFALLVCYGLRAAERARDDFAFLVALGITLTIGLQSLLNVAVATASVPPKGIALPFISYGGSHLMAAAAAVGVLVRIAADGRELAPPPPLEVSEPEPLLA